MNPDTIQLRPCRDDERSFCYEVKKAALRAYVEPIWGWDEKVQIEFHRNDWLNRRPEIILRDGEPIGTMEIALSDAELHLGEFYILPRLQRNGIGSILMKRLTDRADDLALPARLEVIKINPVRSLYQKFGFKTVGDTATHFLMERLPLQPR